MAPTLGLVDDGDEARRSYSFATTWPQWPLQAVEHQLLGDLDLRHRRLRGLPQQRLSERSAALPPLPQTFVAGGPSIFYTLENYTCAGQLDPHGPHAVARRASCTCAACTMENPHHLRLHQPPGPRAPYSSPSTPFFVTDRDRYPALEIPGRSLLPRYTRSSRRTKTPLSSGSPANLDKVTVPGIRSGLQGSILSAPLTPSSTS